MTVVPVIAVTNQSTLVADRDVLAMTAAVGQQLAHHVAPAWGIIPPSVIYMPETTGLRAGVTVIGIFDDSDQAGDLGWHTEVANGIVYGRVFAAPVLQNGGGALAGALSVASVLSHEAIETAGDPACDLWADAGSGTLYARELCDAVESDSYVMTSWPNGVPEVQQVSVSNFLLPSWFDPDAGTGVPFDYMNLCTAPFQVRPAGYTITQAEGTVAEVFGEHYPEWRQATKTYPIARTARRLRQGMHGAPHA